MTTWLPVDSRQHVTAADAALATRLSEAAQDLDRCVLELPSLLHLFREAQEGQPRAATTDPGSGPQPRWCWNHERTTTECDREGLTCAGDPADAGHSDPTGNAAVNHDKAAADAKAHRRDAEQVIRLVERMRSRAEGYPSEAMTLPDVEPTPGEDWCRSCWKDAKACVPITMRPGGKAAFYPGLCRWCGEFEATNGFEPPTWLVSMHRRGERIMQPMVDKARAEWVRLNPPKAKGKVRSKRKRKDQSEEAA